MTTDRMQKQRFEFKYVIQEDLARNLRRFCQAQLELDEAARDSETFSYRVSSIYLDSPDLQTFQDWANANGDRFKLRLRFYDDRPDTPVFLEIKRRARQCILKQRCAIRKDAAASLFTDPLPSEDCLLSANPKQLAAFTNFVRLSRHLRAEPKAVTTYMREAYVDPVNSGVRVTFDREVRIAPSPTLDFSLGFKDYVQPFGASVILELKFTNQFPVWFREMTHTFNLSEGGAAKYCEGVAALWNPEHRHWFARRPRPAGLELPRIDPVPKRVAGGA